LLFTAQKTRKHETEIKENNMSNIYDEIPLEYYEAGEPDDLLVYRNGTCR